MSEFLKTFSEQMLLREHVTEILRQVMDSHVPVELLPEAFPLIVREQIRRSFYVSTIANDGDMLRFYSGVSLAWHRTPLDVIETSILKNQDFIACDGEIKRYIVSHPSVRIDVDDGIVSVLSLAGAVFHLFNVDDIPMRH